MNNIFKIIVDVCMNSDLRPALLEPYTRDNLGDFVKMFAKNEVGQPVPMLEKHHLELLSYVFFFLSRT